MDTSIVLPVLGTFFFAVGLLMPIRDGRRGRRATIVGKGPILARFSLPETSAEGSVGGELPASPAERIIRPEAAAHESADSIDTAEAEANVWRASGDGTASALENAALRSPDRTPPFAVGMRFRSDARRPPEAAVETPGNDDLESFEVACHEESDLEREPTRTATFFARVRRLLAPRRKKAERPQSVKRAAFPVDRDDRPFVESPSSNGVPTDAGTFHDVLATLRGSIEDPTVGGDLDPATAPVSPLVWSRPERGRDRAVPLTRLPLRPLARSVTWTSLLEPAEELATADRRLARLRAAHEGVAGSPSREALGRAWQEERGEARTFALRLLARAAAEADRNAFVDALETGTDEERIVAIDALASVGMLEDIEVALGDRADTVVARASLATCPSRRLEDHRERLDRFVGAARRENILALLSGLLE